MDLVTSQLYFLPDARSDPSLNDIPLSHTAMLHQMAMYQQQPLTPVYSRPSSSSSHSGAPAKTFFAGPRSAMTPAASPSSSRTASLMALEAKLDCSSGYLPSTPPLSSCGGSSFTSAGDMMHTPMNPMFSGLDENFDLCEKWSLDWSGCTSPPMTPLYISQTPASLSRTSTDFSNTSCPSLTQSPSPTPYTRAVSLESSASFCDPRNLTVLSGSVSSAPTSAAAPDVCASFGSSGGAHQQHQQRHGPVVDTAAVQAFVAANPLPSSVAPQGLALDSSDDDFSVHLAGLGDGVSSCDDIRRPRAVTGSSVVSLGHSSFIGEEVVLDPTADDLVLAYLQPPAAKRFRSSDDMSAGASAAAAAAAAASSPMQEGTATTPVAVEDQAQSPSDNASVASDGSSNANTSSSGSSSAKRRGRKQSVTEDPTKTWVCDICHRRFRRQEHLKRHTRSLHTMEKPFKCNDCGKTFSRSDNLAQHARTHGTGAIVMDILDDGTVSSYDPGMMVGEFRELGAALYHMAANAMTTIPDVSGSSSSSHDGSDGSDGSDSDGSNKKKRKRS